LQLLPFEESKQPLLREAVRKIGARNNLSDIPPMRTIFGNADVDLDNAFLEGDSGAGPAKSGAEAQTIIRLP
jgi:hypothetical protein